MYCICVHRWLGSSLESPYEDPMGVSTIGVFADISICMAMWRESEALIHWNWESIIFPIPNPMNRKSSLKTYESRENFWVFSSQNPIYDLPKTSESVWVSPQAAQGDRLPQWHQLLCCGHLEPIAPRGEASCWTVDVLGMVMLSYKWRLLVGNCL